MFHAALAPAEEQGVPPASPWLIAVPDKHAADAGREMLARGGNAIDAAVAVQFVLAVVEAPETGIGGGGFLLLHEAGSGALHFYDGRERAPLAATPERFLWLGMTAPFAAAVISGKSVGVPGQVAMLAMAHAAHGRLPWSTLLEPAIRIAATGVPMPPRLRRQLAGDATLALFPDIQRLYLQPSREDSPRLRNTELAATLRLLAEQGAAAFYAPPMADDIIAAARARWLRPSDLEREDFARYQALEREPVCAPYRAWTVCGAPPPSSGGITLLQILGMLEHFDLPAMRPLSAEALHLVAEASRLAFADRARYIGDPDFVEVPVAALLDRDYLAARAALISPAAALPAVSPGLDGAGAADIEPAPEFGTSHSTLVDAEGNVVALTSSIEAPFGSRIVARGFLLNNQLTDFDFQPRLDGRLRANAVEPGKRPRSSMAPTLVLDADGEVVLALGSRGGSRIIGHVLKTLVAVLDWGMSAQAAAELPNFLHRGEGIELERGSVLERQVAALQALGHSVRVLPMTSGTQVVQRVPGGWRGGTDPRLEGVALGE